MTGAASVRRCRLQAVHLSDYRYASPPRDLVTVLRLVPPALRGCQKLVEEEVNVAPIPHAMPRGRDSFGNTVIEAHLERVDRHLTVAVTTTVETLSALDADGNRLPTPVPPEVHLPALPEGAAVYGHFTPMTTPDDTLRALADEAAAAAPPGDGPERFALVARLADRVHRRMTFASGSTQIGTTAAQAWAGGRGVCQDYSHILCALCRYLGIPARYVSGCVPGEGVMHAWVEVWLAGGGVAGAWYAIDPTYNQWVDARYVSIAAGRDYADITPTSGRYFGGANVLKHGTRTTVLFETVEPVEGAL